jgi:dimethylglycine dehydrogenase
MKSHYRAVVIGGGVVGASVLYHLTKKGWHDVALIERLELTSGSTWHAAGGMHTVNGDPNVSKLQQYSINLYQEIETISGQSVGLHMTEGLMLAATEAQALVISRFLNGWLLTDPNSTIRLTSFSQFLRSAQLSMLAF